MNFSYLIKFLLIIIISSKNLEILKPGSWKNITCSNGRFLSCHSGTVNCYNNSELCKKYYGSLVNITCSNGDKILCNEGTINCTDNSTTFCNKELLGKMTSITCHNNISYVIYKINCPSGTSDCYDDSPSYCH